MRGLLGAFLCTVLLGGSAAAADDPDERRAVILVRTLAFDRNLASRAKDQVVLALVVLPGTRDQAVDRMLASLVELEKLTVKKLPFHVVKVELGDLASFETFLAEHKVNALLIGPGLEARVHDLVAITRRGKVLSMAWSVEAIERGACLGVSFEGARPRLNVNLAACQEEGVAFESQMLELARIVRGGGVR